MRLNKFIASASSLSRRGADDAITRNRVMVNGQVATPGMDVGPSDVVTLDDQRITPDVRVVTILFNKPVGYIVSRDGQGGRTIYDLVPAEYQHLNPVGRLDKDSSGLLLLTNDGQLAHELTHPSKQKQKVYQVTLDTPLTPDDLAKLQQGIKLEDGPSQLTVTPSRARQGGPNTPQDLSIPPTPTQHDGFTYEVTMHEGRNRQIRRTFDALGHSVVQLHRIQFGAYMLGSTNPGEHRLI